MLVPGTVAFSYTTFLTGTELEHSHAIVTELTKLIRAALSSPMQFVKLEGDAVFCVRATGIDPREADQSDSRGSVGSGLNREGGREVCRASLTPSSSKPGM